MTHSLTHSAPLGVPIGRIPIAKKPESCRPGTQRYKRQFGDALVRVRYRKNPGTGTQGW